MSEREQLREALAEALAAADAEQFGYEVTSDYEGADAVLAVLDQQGWPQDCPTVEAAEPATPVSPLGTPLRNEIAWLLYCIDEGYVLPEDRAILSNWFNEPVEDLHPDDQATRPVWLELADVMITTVERDVALRALAEADNHHNAGACPYCTHNGEFVLVKASELAALREAARYEQVRGRLQERLVMARDVLDKEGYENVAALVPIEEVLIWMDEADG